MIKAEEMNKIAQNVIDQQNEITKKYVNSWLEQEVAPKIVEAASKGHFDIMVSIPFENREIIRSVSQTLHDNGFWVGLIGKSEIVINWRIQTL
jgi:hypothetical protein